MQRPWFPDLRGDDRAPDAFQGGALTREWVLAAYPRGFFPWPFEGEPLTWWCPRVRMVFEPGGLHVSRRARRSMRGSRFTATFDSAFERVLGRCRDQRRPGREGTWITPEITEVYSELHARGIAHSVEIWADGELAGGLYGLSMGGMFFGESMVSDRPDASKAAMAVLLEHLGAWGMDLLDCQVPNEHLIRMGGAFMARRDFLELLSASLRRPGRPGPWRTEPDLVRRAGLLGATRESPGGAEGPSPSAE